MNRPYLVTWEIDMDADTPREAAEKAMEIQRDPQSRATVFSVHEHDGEATHIDLLEE